MKTVFCLNVKGLAIPRNVRVIKVDSDLRDLLTDWEFMDVCHELIDEADELILQSGWEKFNDGHIVHSIALRMGKPIQYGGIVHV